ncbi:MAG: T9SS type A sorting domain-containing protein [Flavobacteriia bacterium]|nr:T9SS type A sorting domain-containing protein [Flavobacteriia bacterium]
MKQIILISFSLLLCMGVMSQTSTSSYITCSDFHITKPLSELSKEAPYVEKKKAHKESEDREHRQPQKFVYTMEDGVVYGEDPAVRQTAMGTKNPANKAPIKNWAGQPANGSRPLDPTGAAGTNHYVQAVNASPFRVYNKSTGNIMLTANIGTLWNPDTPNEGDPIVMYDRFADRWFIAQFGSPAKIYIAISTTNDPTGSYYTYTFNSAQFPDYLKFSIWADGYYMTSNQGGRMYCFERDQMLLGNASSRAVTATFTTGSTSGFYCPLSADADDVLPTVGTPCPFFAYADNAWGGGAVDGVKIWNMAVSWGATPTASITLNTTVSTSAFDASYDSGWDDISQPGTSQKLDGIGGVATYRAQFRTWNGYNTVLLNWGVKLSATQRSIRWVELRQNQTTGAWTLYQEGTYAPDTHSRWIGSIAMDDNGSIGLAYCKSSTSVYPSLAYTGRLAGDPLGTMTFAETVAAAGTSAETSANRYGDYSQLSLDPDGVTFWHTGEYTTSGNTNTRIFSFQFPITNDASVIISSNDADNSICAGQSVTFTAAPTNGGTTPSYQWMVDGLNVGTDSPTYTTTTLTAGQIVTCIMTSNLPGVNGSPATSNGITISYNSAPTASIAITSGTNPTCAGNLVTFTISTTNGGSSPSYQWKINSGNVGTSATTYSSSALANNDVISCTYTSTCGSVNVVNTNSITMTVNPLPATPTITQNGLTLTSSSATGNQWYLNGAIINGATSQSYTATQNGNYTVKVTSGGCTSAASVVTAVTTVGINEVTNTGTHFTLYPNPSNGVFSLVFTSTEIMKYTVKLQNALGQIIYEEKLDKFNGTFIKDFDITQYGSGEYFLIITNDKKQKFEKVIVF